MFIVEEWERHGFSRAEERGLKPHDL